MAVDERHPCCVRSGGRLWVVPGQGTAEARPRPGGRARVAATGALIGAVLLAIVAWTVWGMRDGISLATVGLLGAVVGAVTAVGTARLVEPEAPEPAVPTGAVELLPGIARLAPDDATGDELVAWAGRGLRLRRARRALLDGGPPSPDPFGTGGGTVAARIAAAEREHREAAAAWAPVGELLGLRDP